MPEPSTSAPPARQDRSAIEVTAAEPADVRVAGTANPLVSIVIVTFGTGPVVIDALSAVAAHTRLPYEVVVVDNPRDGTRPTGDTLRARTSGVRLVTPDENLGFGGGNELGVAVSSGELICFLNPDVIVAPGWLEPLAAALDDPTVAVAGPVLLNPDGTIQEAGRVVYADGWTGAIAGRDLLTGDREQLFSRDVDYVSAACWLVRRSEHLARGGFSADYHPAFFEDVDYALRVESAGQRSRLVVDVPVIHHHGLGGAGTDAEPHESYRRFCATWQERLAELAPPPRTAGEARRARDRLAVEHVAWVDRGATARARRRGLTEAITHAREHPRARVTFITPMADGLELERARRAGVEAVVGDVDALLDERADVLTAKREVGGLTSLLRGAAGRRWLLLAAVVALAGAVLRAIVLRSPAGALNGDEAYTGIEAFGILDGDLPVVLGGAVYTLPFESYLYAPFLAVFGAQIVPLKLLSTMFWVVAAVVVAAIGARLRRRRSGAIAAALFWITPGGMLLLSVTAYVAYSSGMLVTLLAFLLALGIIDDDERPDWVLGLFGACAGFGVWLHPMYLSTLLPMVAAVLLVRRRPRAWAWVIGGGVVGGGPFLLWNVVNGFPSLDPPVDLEDTYADRLRTFGVDLMPRALGLRDFSLDWELHAAFGVILYGAFIALCGFGLYVLVSRGTRRSRFLLPLVIVAAFPIMAIFENLIYAADGRYGVITFPFLLVAGGVGIDELMGNATRRAVGVVAVVGAVWMLGFVWPGVDPLVDRGDAGPNDPIAEIVGRLDDAGIDRIAGSYWGVLPIEFGADREVFAAVTPGWPVRFPERQRVVEASPPDSVAFVFRLDNERPDQLWLGIDEYVREEIGGFALYLPVDAG